MSKEVIFQVFDWNYNDVDVGEDEDELYKYRIHLYGRTKDNKTVHVQVNDFTPYFMVQIPKTWGSRHIKSFISTVQKKVWYKSQNALKDYDVVSKYKFEKFTNYESFHFLRLTFHSYKGFRAYERAFRKKIFCRTVNRSPKKYKVFESNI